MCISSITSGFCAESDFTKNSLTYNNVSNDEFFLQTVRSDKNSSDTTKTVSDSNEYEVPYKIRQLNLPDDSFKSKIINKSYFNANNSNKVMHEVSSNKLLSNKLLSNKISRTENFEICINSIKLKNSKMQNFTDLDLGLAFKVRKELKEKKIDLYSKVDSIDLKNLNQKFIPFLNFIIHSCTLSLERSKYFNENSSIFNLALIISPIELLYSSIKNIRDSYSDFLKNEILKQNFKKS